MKHFLLVRHGLIDYNTQALNEDGRDFALTLTKLVKLYPIECIITDEEERCVDTIKPLSTSLKIDPILLSKMDFSNAVDVLNRAPSATTSIICYRIESVNPLLEVLKLPIFTPETRDSAYEFIWSIHLGGNGGVAEHKQIPTGFRKPQ
ncbi:MAG: histidine phosphatase family protein [Prosthecobacter sp.]|jgi:hypothetical protein